ncbi:MAG: hypothetical protein ACE5H8_04240 [Alphaproteobacteria bacterium]
MICIGRVALFVTLVATTATSAADESTIVISREDCARVVAHTPAPDVAYASGVDVRGRPVAPADLGDTPRLDIDGEDVDVVIDIPLRAVPGIPGDEGRFTGQGGGAIDRFAADAEVGVVTVEDGEVLFDGVPITNRELERIAAACRDQ